MTDQLDVLVNKKVRVHMSKYAMSFDGALCKLDHGNGLVTLKKSDKKRMFFGLSDVGCIEEL